jgi:hypothetical protein
MSTLDQDNGTMSNVKASSLGVENGSVTTTAAAGEPSMTTTATTLSTKNNGALLAQELPSFPFPSKQETVTVPRSVSSQSQYARQEQRHGDMGNSSTALHRHSAPLSASLPPKMKLRSPGQRMASNDNCYPTNTNYEFLDDDYLPSYESNHSDEQRPPLSYHGHPYAPQQQQQHVPRASTFPNRVHTATSSTTEPAKIRLGICAMDKKARSKPMAEILSRLDETVFDVIFF